MRGAPAQQQLKVAIDSVLKEFAAQLLALANGKAPAAPQPKATQPAPTGVDQPQWSGFSPAPPPGVDQRDPGPHSIAEKKADTFPKQLPDESLAQYALRTAAQTGFNVSHLGALLHTVTASPGTSFAELVDRHQNPTAYWDKTEVDRQNMMRERDIQAANRMFTGPVRAVLVLAPEPHRGRRGEAVRGAAVANDVRRAGLGSPWTVRGVPFPGREA